MKPLAQHLASSGVEFVQGSLTDHGLGRSRSFILQGGTALEHLLKAALAMRNPLLIAERGRSVKGISWFVDEALHVAQPPLELRTIGLTDCIKIAAELGIPITPWIDTAEEFAKHRNGVAHIGVGMMSEAEQLLPGYLRLLMRLGNDLGLEIVDLFGPHLDFALTQISQHEAEVDRILAGRLAQARRRFEERFAGVRENAVEAIRKDAAIAAERLATIDQQLVECPACGAKTLTLGETVLVDWEPEYDRDGMATSATAVLEFVPAYLECVTCGLDLDSSELVLASKALEDWQASDEDYEAFMERYYADLRAEADYQEYRDRLR